MEIIGEISHASISGSSQIWQAPAGYVLANSQTTDASGNLFIDNTENLSVFNLSAATFFQFHGIYSLDA